MGDVIMEEEIYEVRCPENINRDCLVEASVPGSKSITNRALLLAAMAKGTSVIHNCLASDDSLYFMECLKTLGFSVELEPEGTLGNQVTIRGLGGEIPCKEATLNVGSAGTAARFLAAMLAFSDGEYTLESSEQMKKRPMQPLIDALEQAGARVECLEEKGHFPLHITGVKRRLSDAVPERITVNIDQSSQFLSALLIAAGTLHRTLEIDVEGSHGLSYAELTVKMMKRFGVIVNQKVVRGKLRFLLNGDAAYQAMDYVVEPDMSAASYFYALAAVLGVRMTVPGVSFPMLQGDTEFIKVLEKMGCTVDETDSRGLVVAGPADGMLKGGFLLDMSAFSDQALTLAAIAPYADAPVTITGIGHIRLQECDRIQAIVRNLTALGIETEERADEVTIFPGVPKGCEIETYDDHRVAMAFALTGLRTKGVKILNPSCCKKTFGEYFEVLGQVLSKLCILT